MDIIYTFSNTYAVITAEQILLAENIKVKVRPIPTAIRAGCGLSLCVAQENVQKTDKLLADNSIQAEQKYQQQGDKFIPVE